MNVASITKKGLDEKHPESVKKFMKELILKRVGDKLKLEEIMKAIEDAVNLDNDLLSGINRIRAYNFIPNGLEDYNNNNVLLKQEINEFIAYKENLELEIEQFEYRIYIGNVYMEFFSDPRSGLFPENYGEIIPIVSGSYELTTYNNKVQELAGLLLKDWLNFTGSEKLKNTDFIPDKMRYSYEFLISHIKE